MNNLEHVGWVYLIGFVGGDSLNWVFKTEEEALTYCKHHYPNTPYQIVPIPVFKYQKVDKTK